MNFSLSLSKRLLGAAAACGLALEYVFFESLFQKDIPNGFALFFTQCVVILGMACAGALMKKRPTLSWYEGAIFALLGSLSGFVTSSERGLALASSGIILGNICLFISFLNQKEAPDTAFSFISWTIIQPAEKLVQSVARICEHIANFWKRRSSKQKAAIIGTPLALITILLLSTVNPLLEKVIEKIGEILPEYFFAHILIIAITSSAFFFLFIAASLSESHHQPHASKPSHISWDVVLLFLNIPLVLFVVLQLTTYLMELTGNMTFSYSYSEYATKGFSQACIATFLCGGCALIAWARSEKKEKLLTSSVVLAASLVVLALVSASRVIAYIQEFGFTPARIMGALGIGTLLLGVIVGSTVLITQKNVQKTILSIGTLFAIFVTLCPLLQLDKKSAELNILRATTEHPFDSNAMADLSIEAYPTFLEAVDDGVPMEGMIVDCKSNRGDYGRFLRNITKITNDETKTRWINQTAPKMDMLNYLGNHAEPEKCY